MASTGKASVGSTIGDMMDRTMGTLLANTLRTSQDTSSNSDIPTPLAKQYSDQGYATSIYPSSRNTYADAQSDYDSGKITDRERTAAEHQKHIAAFNAQATKDQLSQQLENYDFANRQNRRLADVQRKQNSRKTEADRFEAMRDLQNAALGMFGSMGTAMNGSSIGNLMRMLENRADKDNATFWTQHQVNQDAVENAYDEAANQNQVSKNDAIINAQQAIRGIEGDLAANLNNINPNLFEIPGTGNADLGATDAYRTQKVAENNARLSGYLMPSSSVQSARDVAPRNRLLSNDYFSRLINQFNRR